MHSFYLDKFFYFDKPGRKQVFNFLVGLSELIDALIKICSFGLVGSSFSFWVLSTLTLKELERRMGATK